MEIRIQSLKFNADQKLLDFVEKKFSRIEKFYDGITGVEVALSLLPDHENKNVKVQVSIPGNTVVVEKNAKTFEDAVVDCADILKEKLVKESKPVPAQVPQTAPEAESPKEIAPPKKESSDLSEAMLASLDNVTKQVFAALPVDHAVSPDAIVPEGVSIGDVITSLTLLELSGLVTSLPGGLYQRK